MRSQSKASINCGLTKLVSEEALYIFQHQLLAGETHRKRPTERTVWLSPVNLKNNEKVIVVVSHLVLGCLIITAVDTVNQ